MRRYLGAVSVIILVSTFIILQLGVGKLQGNMGMNILMVGAGISILTALFSKRRWRKVLLIVYGTLLSVFILMVISFGIAHM